MANFLLPRSHPPIPAKKHKLGYDEVQQDKENPSFKKLKLDTTTFKENRGPLIDRNNICNETTWKRKYKLQDDDEKQSKENSSHNKLKPATMLNENRGSLFDRKNICNEWNTKITQDTRNAVAPKRQTPVSTSLSLTPTSCSLQRRSQRCTVQNRWGCISPISENKFAPLTVVLHQGIPDGRLKLNKKNTLCRGSAGTHRQGLVEGYFDDFYTIDLLDDIVYIQSHIQNGNTLTTNFLQMFNACLSSRCIVINWLIHVQEYLNLPYQEIFTIVYLFDLVLSRTKIAINMYQLVGIIILWIVSKNDDIVNSPMAPKMLALCKGVYTKQQFLKMEKKLLVFFDFRFNIADVSIFVLFYMKKLDIEYNCLNKFLNCVHYVLECFTLNEMYSTKLPSLKAAAAVSLVLNILKRQCPKVWDLEDVEEIHILENEMLNQVQIIQDPRFPYRQPYIKYSSAKYCQASIVILQNLVAS